jgi:DNA-binding transcriptional MerR regulator
MTIKGSATDGTKGPATDGTKSAATDSISRPAADGIRRPAADKAPGAFLTIREVADQLGVAQHVLRFWETRFPELRPLKRGGNRRYYRPDDVALAAALHRLLHQEGYTVKGVQRLLAEKGVRAVAVGAADHVPASPATAAQPAHPAGAAEIPAELLARLAALRRRLSSALAPTA